MQKQTADTRVRVDGKEYRIAEVIGLDLGPGKDVSRFILEDANSAQWIAYGRSVRYNSRLVRFYPPGGNA